MASFRIAPAMPMDYSHKVLVKNWYEERFRDTEASDHGKTVQELGTTGRVACNDVPWGAPGMFNTTKGDTDKSMLTSPPPKPINKPSMYNDTNLHERIGAYGTPGTLRYSLGRNPVEVASQPPPKDLATTNQVFYEQAPQVATLRNPALYTVDKSRAYTRTYARDALTHPSPEELPMQGSVAGKGMRGEITRRPGESGNPYGVSVFVDEYGKWGTQLKGVTLGETVAKKQTKYF